jgi:polyhydroxyalkanoate synthesis regulator phasin
MPRNMLQYSEASSRYLGKLRYTQDVHEALTHMRELTKLSDKDSQVRTQVLQELTKRFGENVASINEPPRALRLLMTATMMARLASPMYHVVNGTQPGMVTLPVLAGHYGMLRSAAALMRSYSTVGAGKLLWSGVTDTATAVRRIREVGLDTNDLIGSIRAKLAKEPDGAGLVRMFDELVRTGQLNPEKGFELASAITRGGKSADVALAKVERITRQMGHAVEALNRATTAVTAYRLGRSIADMTEEQAIAHAKDMVDQTQFNYSTYNQPRFMKNHPWASPAFQFKKYAQNMIFLMGDMVRRASFGTPQEKKIAARQLMSLLAVQMAMAGAAGLPGLELLKVGFMVASMLGLGGGWEDWQRKLRKTFEASIGKTPTELISKGIITRGIAQFVPFPDLSSRVSLADLATFGEPKSGSRDDTQAYLFNLIAGAPGGLVLDWADAAKLAGEGEFGKAFIKAVPAKIVADIAKAVKGYTDRDLNEGDAVIQALGARSVRAANEGETKGEAIATNKKLEEERKALTRQYINATSQGELLKLKARILAHNAQAKETNHPRQSVGTKGLDAIRAKEKARRDKIQGE